MGYWNASPEGASLQEENTGLTWGDTPADIFDEAVEDVERLFTREFGRRPSKAELRAGLEFTLGGYEEPDPVN